MAVILALWLLQKVWVKTRKGRGYHKFDYHSHGAAHKRNSELFWKCREDFARKYGVAFEGTGDTTDPGESKCREQTEKWFRTVFSVLGAAVPAARAADIDPVRALRYE
jgi:hypothetical protein